MVVDHTTGPSASACGSQAVNWLVTERVARIELAIRRWERLLLPLQHTRVPAPFYVLARQPRPVEFLRRLSSVTVGAPNITLFDFGKHV